MLELVKGSHKRTGLPKQFLLSVFLFVLAVPYSTVSILCKKESTVEKLQNSH